MTQAPLDRMMRDAWKQVRLDHIRGAVGQAIDMLEEYDVMQVVPPEPTLQDLEEVTRAVRAALLACSNQLRNGCGLAEVGGPEQVERRVDGANLHYDQRREEALESYRAVVCRQLEPTFAKLAEPAAG